MLPVRQRGQQQAVDVLQHRVETLRLFGRRRWQAGQQRAGFDGRLDRSVGDVGAVVGDPVDDAMAKPTKILGTQEQLVVSGGGHGFPGWWKR